MTPKNIHKIFIPQNIFIFLKTPKYIEIQNFDPKNGPSLHMYENIRVPPWAGRSFMNRRNNSDPKTVPCGTPLMTLYCLRLLLQPAPFESCRLGMIVSIGVHCP